MGISPPGDAAKIEKQEIEMNEQEQCKNCRFWNVLTTFYDSDRVYESECRRRAPTASDGPEYPQTYPAGWCGEWEAEKE